MKTLYQLSTMKKLLLLSLLFTGMANAQIVTIPDANFKAKLVTANATDAANKIAQNFNDEYIKIDANGDGEIQLSEAQAVKRLTVNNYLIKDITGINSFSNLQILNISNNQLTTLDLNALTSLKTLYLSGMYAVTALNVNSLTNLTSLICFDLQSITSLNISNLTNLTSLSIAYCSLSTLNINGLTALTDLNCSGNKLTNLNGLSTKLIKLRCSENLLTNLNISALTNLTELDCSYNKLTNLNGLPNLTKLSCSGNELTNLNFNGLSNLTELYCSNNQLTNLNVDSLSNLTKLYCASNLLTSLNINGLPNLVNLYCGNNNDLASLTLANLPSLQELSVIGDIASNATVLSHLTSLNLSGLPNLQKLDCSNGMLISLDINGLTNLKEVNCSRNQITSLNLSNLPSLQKLDCNTNPIVNLNASNLTSLTDLNCGGGYIVDGQIIPNLNALNVSGSINLKKLSCSFNQLTSLDLTGLVHLEELYCDGDPNGLGKLTSLNVNGLTSLRILSCTNQKLTSLNVNNLVNLTDLYCSYNKISSLDLTGLINLKILDYNYNKLSNLNLIDLPSLTTLNCANNQLITLNVLNLTNLKDLNCSFNQLTTLNLSGLSSLVSLNFSDNQIALSNVSGLSTNLKLLYCDNNALTSLEISNLTSLENLSCSRNQLASIDFSSLNNLKNLNAAANQFTIIDVSNLTLLEGLSVDDNQLTALNLNGLTTLKQLSYSNNVIPNLDVSFLTNLQYLHCSNTQSTVLDVTTLPNLNFLFCSNNQLTVLDLSGSKYLGYIECQNNQITTLDLSSRTYYNTLICDNNQLETLFLKNGANETLSFTNNPNLKYICADAFQLESIQTQLNDLSMNTTVANSYCTFTPGGNHNTINGIAIFDADNNGCDVTDVVNPFVRFNINDGTVDGATVTNINGSYNFYTNAGTYVIAPNTENPNWFTFSPNSATFPFLDDNNNISTQNFCIAAVGVHQDIEVVITQLETARPGFDAPYKIVFKNKGNQMVSGTVNLQFDDARTDLVLAIPSADASATNSLSWNFTNLMPFENRSILLTLNINEPGETPAVNNGDVLNFKVAVTPIVGDDFPSDNQFNYNQTVLGSFDPNDIICLEGNTVAPSEIGKYLHYAVSFENTGDFYAENVVVKIEVDATKYDINSLQLLNTSHPSSTRISGNVVEFIFKNIKLAEVKGDPPVGGHGDILFKIKSKGDLAVGDAVTKKANIYFDYNFPIVTNDAETTFAALNSKGFELDSSIAVYPNPATTRINIKATTAIKTINLYDIQGRVIETLIGNNTFLDISNKQNGIYFLKVTTEKGSKVEKIVKN